MTHPRNAKAIDRTIDKIMNPPHMSRNGELLTKVHHNHPKATDDAMMRATMAAMQSQVVQTLSRPRRSSFEISSAAIDLNSSIPTSRKSQRLATNAFVMDAPDTEAILRTLPFSFA